MMPPPAVHKAFARLDRTLADALPDLAWLSRVYAGGRLGEQMVNVHGHVTALREAMAQEAMTDEQQP